MTIDKLSEAPIETNENEARQLTPTEVAALNATTLADAAAPSTYAIYCRKYPASHTGTVPACSNNCPCEANNPFSSRAPDVFATMTHMKQAKKNAELVDMIMSYGAMRYRTGCSSDGTASKLHAEAEIRMDAIKVAIADLAMTKVSNSLFEKFDFEAHLNRQSLWSCITFGPGARSKGVVDHIRKELLEIEADPLDLKEWIDVVILALDGAWRTGATPQQIIEAIVAKQTKNEGRVWPDWRTADPNKAIEHDRKHDHPAGDHE